MSVLIVSDSYYGLAQAHALAKLLPDVHCALINNAQIPRSTSLVAAVLCSYESLLEYLRNEAPCIIICLASSAVDVVCEYYETQSMPVMNRNVPQIVPRILYIGFRYPQVTGSMNRESTLMGCISLMRSSNHSTIECGCFPTSMRDVNILIPSPLLIEGVFEPHIELTSFKTLTRVICRWINDGGDPINIILKHQYRWSPELFRETAGYNRGIFHSRAVDFSQMMTVESNAHILYGPIIDNTLEEITGFYQI